MFIAIVSLALFIISDIVELFVMVMCFGDYDGSCVNQSKV